MTYARFKTIVAENGWTIRQLRSDDAPPTAALLDLMDRLGLHNYERYVLRLQAEESSC